MEHAAGRSFLRDQRRKALMLPRYTLGEEITNGITHGLGAVLAVVGTVVLLIHAPKNALSIVSVSLYSASMVLLYCISTLYHALGVNRAKKVFQVLESLHDLSAHCRHVYAGFASVHRRFHRLDSGVDRVGIRRGGHCAQCRKHAEFRVVSMISYMAMGWCVIFFLPALLAAIDTVSLILLVAGGVLYTGGAIFYGVGRKVKYMHGVWHVFCLAGSVLHFLVVYRICG